MPCEIVVTQVLEDISASVFKVVQEDVTLHQQRCENLKSSTLYTCTPRCIIGLSFALFNPLKLGGYFM